MPSDQQAVAPPADYEGLREGGTYGLAAGVLGILGGLLSAHFRAAGYAVSVVSTLLFLLALRRLSRAIGEPRLFTYGAYLVAVGAGGGLAALLLVDYAVAVGAVGRGSAVVGLLTFIYAVVVALGYLFRRVYLLLSEGVAAPAPDASDMFEEAATLYWIGALLTAVLVGAFFMLAGAVYAVRGFGELRRAQPPAAAGREGSGAAQPGPT